jgi:hypothetical protein
MALTKPIAKDQRRYRQKGSESKMFQSVSKLVFFREDPTLPQTIPHFAKPYQRWRLC